MRISKTNIIVLSDFEVKQAIAYYVNKELNIDLTISDIEISTEISDPKKFGNVTATCIKSIEEKTLTGNKLSEDESIKPRFSIISKDPDLLLFDRDQHVELTRETLQLFNNKIIEIKYDCSIPDEKDQYRTTTTQGKLEIDVNTDWFYLYDKDKIGQNYKMANQFSKMNENGSRIHFIKQLEDFPKNN